MASYPSALASFAGFTPGHTLAADGHGAQHNLEQGEILAVQTKVGTGSSAPAANLVLVGTGASTSSWSQVNLVTMVTGTLPVANGGTGATTTAGAAANLGVEIGKLLFPVGCVYTETTGTNPGTTFGFGTWIAFGAGQVLVGNGTSDQLFTAGSTGGESTHLLTAAESGLPAHTHIENFSSGALNGVVGVAQTANQSTAPGINSTYTTAANTTATASSSHNNLQPYIVVYFWKRTV